MTSSAHSPAVGLDFGTTNSALAFARDGVAELARFARSDGSLVSTFRSVLFFETPANRGGAQTALAGPRALERYYETGGDGRLLQSLKSFLASPLFTGTTVHGRRVSLEELISAVLMRLRQEVEQSHGALPRTIVMGRPVRFVDDENEGEALALKRLRAAAALAGFEDVHFELEPVAAAHSYERSLDHDELVLVGDFGGGTSDFCLVRLGPSRKDPASRAKAMLGSEGIGLAGDAFDGEIVRHAVAPSLGEGGTYRSFMEQRDVPIPPWIFEKLRRWHHLSILKAPDTLRFLNEMRIQANERDKIEALVHLVDSDLGPQLFSVVEGTKVALSSKTEHTLAFSDPPTEISEHCTRAAFDQWIGAHIAAMDACVERLLTRANVSARDIDRVFLTGGSALVPAVRGRFVSRFGESKLEGGNELTSVATGLALVAEQTL